MPTRLAELLWLVACLGFIWLLCLPMNTPEAAAGMDQRYTITAQELPARAQVSINNPQATARQQERAHWLHSNLALYLTVLALVGWAALVVGRMSLPWSTQVMLLVPIWCGVAAWCGSLGLSLSQWSSCAVAACGVGLLGALLQRWITGRAARPVVQSIVSAWRYPGFVFLSGLGLIWLTDLAARGTLKQLFIGVRQADSLLLAYAAFTLAAATCPSLLVGFAHVATRIEDRLANAKAGTTGSIVLILLAVPSLSLVLALKWVYISPSLFGELVRVPFWVVCGWIMYRWVDRDRPSLWAFLLVLVCQALLLATYVVGDKGQSMVMMLSMCVPISVLIVPMLLGHKIPIATSRLMRGVIAAVVWMPFLTLVILGIWTFGPRLGSHIAERLEAIQAPFTAGNDFLAQLFWLSHAAGFKGFDLTHVPWCGNMGSIGSVCRGVPEQLQSDYVIQGLAAVWGMPIAIGLVLTLCFWLLGMFRLSSGAQSQMRSMQALRAWVLAFFAVMLVTQAFVTTFGALGVLPMTGVPLPLFAYGGAGLLFIAFFAGLSMNQWIEGSAPANSKGWKHV